MYQRAKRYNLQRDTRFGISARGKLANAAQDPGLNFFSTSSKLHLKNTAAVPTAAKAAANSDARSVGSSGNSKKALRPPSQNMLAALGSTSQEVNTLAASWRRSKLRVRPSTSHILAPVTSATSRPVETGETEFRVVFFGQGALQFRMLFNWRPSRGTPEVAAGFLHRTDKHRA